MGPLLLSSQETGKGAVAAKFICTRGVLSFLPALANTEFPILSMFEHSDLSKSMDCNGKGE